MRSRTLPGSTYANPSPDVCMLGFSTGISVRFLPERRADLIQWIRDRFEAHGFPSQHIQFKHQIYELTVLSDRLKKPLKYFVPFAIASLLVSLLGVYSMSLFNAEAKVREVGIRKVLGATTGPMLRRLLVQNSWALIVALVLAVPLTHLALEPLLVDMEVRVPVWLVLLVITPVIMLLTQVAVASWQFLTAAKTSPALVLNRE